jgi:hypothetical protein
MEVAFDREKPNDDRFEVGVYDAAGNLLRVERYTREEIATTYGALFGTTPELRAEHAARWDKIRVLFPEPGSEKLQGAPKPGPKE